MQKRAIILTLIAVVFYLFVWPGLYRYDHLEGYLIRINRVTNSVSVFSAGQWVTPSGPAQPVVQAPMSSVRYPEPALPAPKK